MKTKGRKPPQAAETVAQAKDAAERATSEAKTAKKKARLAKAKLRAARKTLKSAERAAKKARKDARRAKKALALLLARQLDKRRRVKKSGKSKPVPKRAMRTRRRKPSTSQPEPVMLAPTSLAAMPVDPTS